MKDLTFVYILIVMLAVILGGAMLIAGKHLTAAIIALLAVGSGVGLVVGNSLDHPWWGITVGATSIIVLIIGYTAVSNR